MAARSPTPRLNFTNRSIEGLRPSAEDFKNGRAEYLDTEAPGLYLRVTPTGVKTFSYVGRAKGARKSERFTIGRFPIVKPEEARRKAWEMAGKQATGSSVTKDAQERRREMTLDELKVKYAKDLRKRDAKTVRAFEEMYVRHIQPYFGKLRLSEVEGTQVGEWHEKLPGIILKERADEAAERARREQERRAEIEERARQRGRRNGPRPSDKPKVNTSTVVVNGKTAANRALFRLRAMFNWAGKQPRNYFLGRNPAAGHTPYSETERQRFLKPGEARAFFEALRDEPNVTARDCIMIKLLTGARRANAHAMRWEHLDFTEAVWHIPAEESKNGEPHDVPLVPEAVALLLQRKKVATSPWVFPAERSDSKTGHIGNLREAWHRVMVRSGLTNLRQHDLRRTLGSWQARQGATLLLIGKSLNHKDSASTAIYARLDIEPVRASMGQATAGMFEAGGLKEAGNIIPFPGQVNAKTKAKKAAPVAKARRKK